LRRPRDNGVEIAGKVRKIQMAVTVDEHGASAPFP